MGHWWNNEITIETEKVSKVLNPRLMSFDEHGNLRYGAPERDRNDELTKILNTDKNHYDEEGKEWYIMDSVWVHSWLLFVHLDPDNSPAPGPCRNDRLITTRLTDLHKRGSSRIKAKPNLIMATQKRAGDYRRVTRETWEMFKSLYAGSGPDIIAVFPGIVKTTPESMKERNVLDTDIVGAEVGLEADGRYDTSTWVIRESAAKKERGGLNVEKVLQDGVEEVGKFFGGIGGVIQDQVQGWGRSVKTSPLRPPFLGTPTSDPIPTKTSFPSPSQASLSSRTITLQSTTTPIPKYVRRTDQFYDEMFFASEEEDEGMELAEMEKSAGGRLSRASRLSHTAASTTSTSSTIAAISVNPNSVHPSAHEPTGSSCDSPSGKVDDPHIYEAAYARPGGSIFEGMPPRGRE